MTAQHTPGPWTNVDGEITKQGGHPYICTVVGAANPAYPQQAANAALIAAAPELEDQLSLLVRTVYDTLRHGLTDGQRQALEEVCTEAAALLKRTQEAQL